MFNRMMCGFAALAVTVLLAACGLPENDRRDDGPAAAAQADGGTEETTPTAETGNGGQLLVAKSDAATDEIVPLGTARVLTYGLRLCAGEQPVEIGYLKLSVTPMDGGQVITEAGRRYFTNFVVMDEAVVVAGPAELANGVYVTPEGWPMWSAHFSDSFTVAAGTCREIAFRCDVAYDEENPGDIDGKRYRVHLSQIETDGRVSFAGDVGPEPAVVTVIR